MKKFIIKYLQAILILSFFLVSCSDDMSVHKKENNESSNVSYEEKKLVGSIPNKFIHLEPEQAPNEKNTTRALIVFDSDDIINYSGAYFSVRLFLTHYMNEIEKNDYGRYLVESRKIWKELYKELPSIQYIIGDEDSYIGKNEVQVIVYKSISPNADIPDREYILVDGKGAALFHQMYEPNKKRNYYGMYEYRTNVANKYAALFIIKIHSFDEFSHQYFFYAKQFIENFYL